MLGKAKEIGVTTLSAENIPSLGQEIVQWLEQNSEAEVLQMDYYGRHVYITYKKVNAEAPGINNGIDLEEDSLPELEVPQSPFMKYIELFKKNDVQFVEKANGHFMIYGDMGQLRCQFWATKEKAITEPSKDHIHGIHTLLHQINIAKANGNW